MTNEEAIAEIVEIGLYGNQVHQETLELALSALRAQQGDSAIRRRRTTKYCEWRYSEMARDERRGIDGNYNENGICYTVRRL